MCWTPDVYKEVETILRFMRKKYHYIHQQIHVIHKELSPLLGFVLK